MPISSNSLWVVARRHYMRFPRLASAVGLGLFALHTIIASVLHSAPEVTARQRIDFDNIVAVVAGLAMTLAAASLGRDRRINRETRHAWQWFALAFLFQWIGHVWWWLFDTVLRQSSPLASWTDAFYLLFFPFLLVGVLRYPHPRRPREDAARHWLDVAIVVVSGVITLWYFTQFGDALRAEGSPYELVYALGYPLGDVLILVALAVLVIRSAWDTNHRPLQFLTAGLALSLVGDALHATWITQGIDSWGSALDLAWGASATSLALAAWFEHTDVARNRVRLSGTTYLAKPTYLAYASSTLLFGVLVYVGYATGSNQLLVLVIGAAVITALTIIRQVIAVRESGRLSIEAKAMEGEARFRALVQHSSDVIFIVDVDSTIRFVSPAVVAILGREGKELLGQRLVELVHPDDTTSALRLISHAATGVHTTPRGECRLQHGDGRWILLEHVATNLLEERIVSGIVLNSRDVTEREELQRRLTHQAFHDPLTNLANRALFLDRVDHAMHRLARDPTQVALLFIDMDDFKKVNDSLGHSTGDAFLVAVADRLRATLRDGDTLARLGGDEFGLLLEDCGGMERAMEVAERVRLVLFDPIVLEGKDILARVSVGIASASEASSPAELMRNADLAMYLAKSRGKGGSARYEPRMHAEIIHRLELEVDLRQAIEHGELYLVYQPIVVLDTLELHGVEALLRWTHPRHGAIPPSQFIPIAEEAGLIASISRWVLRESACQAQAWWKATGSRIHVGVNISGRHIQGGELLDDVRNAVRGSGIAPSQLLLEITESTLMHHGDEVRDVLRGLRATGVCLALDDFGTGYSSLSYLQRFPIDVLKIDKSFIDGIATAGSDPRLVRAIIALGDSLHLRTVAEGIETNAQWRELRELGCAMGQGNLFARPLPADEVTTLIREGLHTVDVDMLATAPAAA